MTIVTLGFLGYTATLITAAWLAGRPAKATTRTEEPASRGVPRLDVERRARR